MTLLRMLLLPTLAAAHFTLDAPASVGPFDEDTEGTSPCGGVTIDWTKDNVTDFHVDGESVSLFLGHPTAKWLFRATLDETASSNWTMIYPVVAQTGLGDYCQPAVAVPSSFAGHKGLIGVVADAPDGLLYQCATVNFVTGSGTQTSDCKNATGVTAAFSSDTSFTALISSNSSRTNGTTTASSDSSSTSSSGNSSSSSSASVAAGLVPSVEGVVGSLVAVFTAGLLGAGLLL